MRRRRRKRRRRRRRSQEEPGGARSKQDQPGGAKGSHEEPGGTRSNREKQEEPWRGIWGRQGDGAAETRWEPEGARRSLEKPGREATDQCGGFASPPRSGHRGRFPPPPLWPHRLSILGCRGHQEGLQESARFFFSLFWQVSLYS